MPGEEVEKQKPDCPKEVSPKLLGSETVFAPCWMWLDEHKLWTWESARERTDISHVSPDVVG